MASCTVAPRHGTERGSELKFAITSKRPRRISSQPRLLVELDRVDIGGRQAPADREQSRVQIGELWIARARQLRALERLRVLRVGNLVRGERRERRELRAPALAGGVGDQRVDVVGEELERRVLAVLLAHEQQRHERREQGAEGGQRTSRRRQPVAHGAVADLVVVLVEHDEPVGRHVVGRSAEAPAAKARVDPVVDVGAVQRLGQIGPPCRTPRSSPRARR